MATQLTNIAHNIKIASINTNSIRHQKADTIELLITEEIDVLLVLLKPGDRFKIPNYDVYRTDSMDP